MFLLSNDMQYGNIYGIMYHLSNTLAHMVDFKAALTAIQHSFQHKKLRNRSCQNVSGLEALKVML